MNILLAKQALLSYFSNKESLNLLDLNKLFINKNNKEEDEASFLIALNELEQLKIVIKYTFAEQNNAKYTTIWVLSKPLNFYEQNLILDGGVASRISGYVNEFLEATGNNSINSNPLNITKDDIIILLDIIDLYAQSNIGENKKKDK